MVYNFFLVWDITLKLAFVSYCVWGSIARLVGGFNFFFIFTPYLGK